MQNPLSITGFLRLAVVVLAALLCTGRCQAIDINSVGNWSLVHNAGNLVSGAGSNLPSLCESGAYQLALTVYNTTGTSDNWRIDVRRSDTNWPAGLTLLVKRTGAGFGFGSISGGLSYLQITASDSAFFSGAGDRIGITVHFDMSGTSISISPGTYSTSIVYTVVDT